MGAFNLTNDNQLEDLGLILLHFLNYSIFLLKVLLLYYSVQMVLLENLEVIILPLYHDCAKWHTLLHSYPVQMDLFEDLEVIILSPITLTQLFQTSHAIA